jgi:CubicO group peptidase (beta-lactamase class C family)
MLLTPKQMIAVGALYLERGRANGRQIVPASWVDASCVPRTTSAWDADRRYGYGWWIQAFRARRGRHFVDDRERGTARPQAEAVRADRGACAAAAGRCSWFALT